MGNVQKMLEQQADRIEATLAAHRTPSRVTGGTVAPRWVRFEVHPTMGSKLAKVRQLNNALAAALGVPDCRVERRGMAFDVEIPRDRPGTVDLLPLLDQLIRGDAIPPVTATLGLEDDGSPLLIRIPSPDVGHVLVTGVDGAGKTTLLQSIALSLAMTNGPEMLRVVNIDLDEGLDTLTGLPHQTRPVIQDAVEAIEALQSLVRLMVLREKYTYADSDLPRVVVFIDGLVFLLAAGGEIAQAALSHLLRRGADASIHVVAATREPIPTLQENIFPVRIVGRVESATDARIASGWTGTGAERLQGSGDFIVVAEGRVMRFQAAHASADAITGMIRQLQSGSSLHVSEHMTYQPTAVQTATLPLPEPTNHLAAVTAAGG